MFASFLGSAFSLFPLETYSIDDKTNATFITQYEGKTERNIAENRPFLEYSTAFDIRYILGSYDNPSRCEYMCASNSECVGVVMYNSNTSCHTLSDLGTYEHTEHDSYSKHKMVIHENPVNNHTIKGYTMTTDQWLENIFVYVDFNLNIHILI